MNKIVIAPKINVYRNMFNDLEDTLRFLKSTEQYTEKTGVMEPWKDWEANWFGKMAEIVTDGFYEIKEYDDEETKKQKNIFNEIKNIYVNVLNDYASMYKDEEGWPTFITSWENFPTDPWDYVREIGILKYNKNQPEHKAKYPLAMHYHMDYNSSDEESRNSKLIITVTFYLNDDYEGG